MWWVIIIIIILIIIKLKKRMKKQKRGSEAYIEGALNEFSSLLGSLRQLWALNGEKIFFLLLVGQGNHELRWPHGRSHVSAAGGRPSLLAIVRSIRWGCGLVVIKVVVMGPPLIVRTPVRWSNSPNAPVALSSSHGTWTFWVPKLQPKNLKRNHNPHVIILCVFFLNRKNVNHII